ncbi:hypothetical protein ACFVYJ_03000 [Pontibacter sp. JAM-7]|uniref:hypothetical protein n=1 Tax=Pontibacter sp. JAM-7 TaxID=3366581 RepID=UPI003AF8F8AD
MFMLDYKQPSWWLWLLTVICLGAGVAGYSLGFKLAMALTVVQVFYFTYQEQDLLAFPVQVRMVYLLLLVVCWQEPFQWLFWLPLLGTTVQLVFGYCLLARCLSLLPGNRWEPISTDLLRRTFLTPPQRGNVMQGLPSDSV